MINKIKIFLKLLCLELEDLFEDTELLIKECSDNHSSGKISEHVCQENLAVLENEISGIKGFCDEVSEINPSDYDNIDQVISDITTRLEKRIRDKGLVHSVLLLICKKIDKVADYIKGKDAGS